MKRCAERRRRRRRIAGFTLLEVLVALAILSIALVALVRMASLEARALAQLQEATLAQWVAANVIAELRIREPRAEPGRRQGSVEMGGRRWRWQMLIEPSAEAKILRLEVDVFVDAGEARLSNPLPSAHLSGFLGR